MKRVTCYKLCYILGVSEKNLCADYNVEYNVAKNAWAPTDSMRRCRELAALYNVIIYNYKQLVDSSVFAEVIAELMVDYTEEFDSEWGASRGEATLIDFLNTLIAEHNALLPQVYRECAIAIPENLFGVLTTLPELTAQKVAQICFLLEKSRHLYGLCFFGYEILNVSIGTMLCDDLSLRDRLSLFSGERLGSLEDTSVFGDAVEAYLAAVFMTDDCIRGYDKYVVYTTDAEKSMALMSCVMKAVGQAQISLCAVPPEFEDIVPGERVLCLSSSSKWVAEVAGKNRGIDFAVVLPIESKYYKQWRRRRLPNVYFIDRAEYLRCNAK